MGIGIEHTVCYVTPDDAIVRVQRRINRAKLLCEAPRETDVAKIRKWISESARQDLPRLRPADHLGVD